MFRPMTHSDYVQQTSFVKNLFDNQKSFQDKSYFLLLLLALIILAGIAVFAYTQGDPGRYIYGADSWGNVCGRQKNTRVTNALLPGLDHSTRKMSFYFISNDVRIAFNPDLVRTERYASICVSDCEVTLTPCEEMLERQGYAIERDVANRRMCTMLENLILPQQVYYGSCVPAEIAQATAQRLSNSIEAYARNRTTQSQLDVYSAPSGYFDVTSLGARFLLSSFWAFWPDIIALSFIALALTLLCLALIQIFGRYVLISSLVISALVACAVTGVFWYSFFFSDKSTSPTEPESGVVSSRLSAIRTYLEIYSLSEIQYLLPICILMTFITIIVIAAIIAIRRNLFTSLSFFDETATHSVMGIPLILLQPIITTVIVLLFLAFAVTTSVYVASSQIAVVDGDGFVTFISRRIPPVWLLLVLLVLASLWVLEFVFACQDIVVAGALSRWYFNYNHKRCLMIGKPVIEPNVALIRYGLGTAALGAVAIPSAQLLRIVSCHAMRHPNAAAVDLERKTQPPGCECCDGNFIYFSNRGALICHAMFGGNFYISGKRAFVLERGYHRDLAALSSFSALSLFLCKLAIVLLTLLATLMWLHERNGFYPIVECLFPILIICIVAFVIAACFLNVYIIAFETIFLCYCVEDYVKRPDIPIEEKESILSKLKSDTLSPASFLTAEEFVEPSAHTNLSDISEKPPGPTLRIFEPQPEIVEPSITKADSLPKVVEAAPPPPPPLPSKVVEVPIYVEVPVSASPPPTLPRRAEPCKRKPCGPCFKFSTCPGINAKTTPPRPCELGELNLIQSSLPATTVCEPWLPQCYPCQPCLPCKPCDPCPQCIPCPPCSPCKPCPSFAPCPVDSAFFQGNPRPINAVQQCPNQYPNSEEYYYNRRRNHYTTISSERDSRSSFESHRQHKRSSMHPSSYPNHRPAHGYDNQNPAGIDAAVLRRFDEKLRAQTKAAVAFENRDERENGSAEIRSPSRSVDESRDSLRKSRAAPERSSYERSSSMRNANDQDHTRKSREAPERSSFERSSSIRYSNDQDHTRYSTQPRFNAVRTSKQQRQSIQDNGVRQSLASGRHSQQFSTIAESHKQ